MTIKLSFFLFLIFFTSSYAQSEESIPVDLMKNDQTVALEYKTMFTEIPKSSLSFLRESFSKDKLWPWVGVLSSTTLLYIYDEEILKETQRFGRRIGLGNEDHTKSYIKIGDLSLFRGPSDLGSAFYFLGDGWTHTSIALGFISYGEFKSNNRARNTGIEVFHGMFVSTIFNQTLKRSFGRESPFVRTKDRGRWRPFPSIKGYSQNTPHYDAMPSGHIMTATMTFTVIRENYPEYDLYLAPLEYTWLTLLSFQMINNGVHWASDYPLGIAMGYLTGKIVAKMAKNDQSEIAPSTWFWWPLAEDGQMGLQAMRRF